MSTTPNPPPLDTLTFTIETEPMELSDGAVTFATVHAWVNGTPFLPLTTDAPLHTLELLVRCNEPGEFNLYTCTCGEAGCAGFTEPVKLEYLGSTIRWLLPKQGYLERFVKSEAREKRLVYEFDAAQYVEAIELLEHDLVSLEMQEGRLVLSPDSVIQNEVAAVAPLREIFFRARTRRKIQKVKQRLFVEIFGDLHDQGIALQFDESRVYWMTVRQYARATEYPRFIDDSDSVDLESRWEIAAMALRTNAKSALLGLGPEAIAAYAEAYDPVGNCWQNGEYLDEAELLTKLSAMRVWIGPYPE